MSYMENYRRCLPRCYMASDVLLGGLFCDSCCNQAVTLKFRPLSIHFTSESFEAVRKMSVKAIFR